MNYCKHVSVLTLTLTVTLILSACGGGNDAPTTDVSQTSSTVPSVPNVPNVPNVPSTQLEAGKTCNLPNFQQELMTLINHARAASRLCGDVNYSATSALTWNKPLFDAAAGHSADMANNNYFSHASLNGNSFQKRLIAAGYMGTTIGENIAAGQATAAIVMQGWIASPGHCSNIMNPNFKEVGVACVSNISSQYRTYWTMDLGRP